MRSRIELGLREFKHGESAVLRVPVRGLLDFEIEVDDVVAVNRVQYVVYGVSELDSGYELNLRRLLPHDWIWLPLKFSWRGAERWLSRACARFRGARN